jgi:hypothetical protein
MKLKLISLSIGTFLFLTHVAIAQTSIEATPSSLTLTGTRCWAWTDCRQQHVLSIQPSDNITNLELIPLPLISTDGRNLPANAIRPTIATPQISADRVLSIPFEFDPNRLPSGEFSGDLLVTYQGGSQRVPVVIKVKDHWALPLGMLLSGVIFGVMVSAYREQGKPRDEVLVRVGRLRTQMSSDLELERAKPFQDWIQDDLIDMETALQSQRFDEANGAIALAETTWIKWRKGRSDWLQLIQYQEKLLKKVTKSELNAPFVQTLMRQLNDALKNMPKLEQPEQLREQLEAIAKQLDQYAQVMSKMATLGALAQSDSSLKSQEQAWQQQIDRISPVSLTTDLAALLSQLEATLGEMTRIEQEINGAIANVVEAPVSRGMERVGRGGAEIAPNIFSLPFVVAPTVRPLSLEQQIGKASRRLRGFVWASYAIAVTFLAGAGFNELYADKATFGAAPWRDYFALLAWGFGAEATREAVTNSIRSWRGKSSPERESAEKSG